MSAKIQYFDAVPLKGTCKLSDNQLRSSGNSAISFPSAGGTLATTTSTQTFQNKTLYSSCKLSTSIKSSSNGTINIPNPTSGNSVTLATTADIPQQQEVEVDLSGLEADVADIETAVGTINTTLATISSNVSSAKTTAEDASTDVNTCLQDIITILSRCTSINSTQTTISNKLTDIENGLGTLQSNFSTALIKACYPVGTVMIRYDSANPNTLTGFSGTTWSTFTSGLSNATAWRRTA